MSWSFFTNAGAMKTSGQITGAVTTIASASSIAVTPGYTHLITGTTGISTMTGGVAGGMVTLVASGQSAGSSVTLNHGTSSNNLSLRNGANLGIYAGESVSFVYDGTKWVEIARNVTVTPQPWVAHLSPLASFANSNWDGTAGNFDVYGNLLYLNSSGAQNAYIEWKVILSAGTWTFAMNHYAGGARGIYTLSIDGGASLGTIDGYASGPSVGAYSTITGITVTTNTNALVRLTMATKNASSSAYYGYLVGAIMQRTA